MTTIMTQASVESCKHAAHSDGHEHLQSWKPSMQNILYNGSTGHVDGDVVGKCLQCCSVKPALDQTYACHLKGAVPSRQCCKQAAHAMRGRPEIVTLTASSPVPTKSCRGRTITRGSRELYALMLSSSSWHTRTCRATSAMLTWHQDCHVWLTNQWLDTSTCNKQHVC